jgi:hypothetical protein
MITISYSLNNDQYLSLVKQWSLSLTRHYLSLVLLCISLYGLLLLYGNLRTVFICHMFSQINVREYRGSYQQWTIQRNCNIGYTRGRKTKQKHNTICVWHHYMQTKTNNETKARALLQTSLYAEIAIPPRCSKETWYSTCTSK